MIQEPQTHPLPRPFAPAAATHCAHCRRELPTGEGHDVPFIGIVGPECVRKYASLRVALTGVNGLQALEWDQGTMILAHHVVMDLRRIGMKVQIVDVKAGVKEVRILGVTRPPKAVVESWAQMRARFEQRLRDAEAEREAEGLVA